MVKRHEILFLYDVKDANPNGDPARENMPRYDPDTETVFVSDVRIKRTIRDCLERSGERIFVTSEFIGDILRGYKEKYKNNNYKKEVVQQILKDFIDVRLFGQVFAYEENKKQKKKTKKSEEETEDEVYPPVPVHGPVQFRFGRSLNRTKPECHKLSSKQPRAKGEATGKFGEKWTVPYAIIGTYGIVNEAVAEETGLSEEDVQKMMECLWRGTEQLQSASKAVHRPILLVDIAWKEGSERLIGNLDEYVRLKKDGKDVTWNGEHGEEGKQIRGVHEITIDITALVNVLQKYRSDIDSIKIRVHPEAEGRIVGLEELRNLAG